MFLEIDKKDKNKIALLDSEGSACSYGDVKDFASLFYSSIKKRSLIFILNDNSVGAAMGYLGAMINRVVPLMLSASMDRGMLEKLIFIYHPEYIWKPANMTECNEEILFEEYQYNLVSTGITAYSLYDELSLLLTTSGSTGSPKLVRHSYANLDAQAKNISKFFALNGKERPILDLPINYTYGLSVLNSHLYSGATVLLTSKNVLDPGYWSFLKEQKATTFTNVPYSFELLKKLHVFQMDIPYLRTFTQGGGKISKELHREFAEYALQTGRKFIVTYGQTEGSARMAYLPAEYAVEKCGSIGKAIPNGELFLVDENGKRITESNVIGEMVYQGPNVTLGYAQTGEDLSVGDERQGVLYTGDMAWKDEEGFFYIVGRKKRFLKLYGYRIGLDECENMIKEAFDIECACVGNDECMDIFITERKQTNKIKDYISERLGINSSAFRVQYIDKIPRNEAGKILYNKL
jgi:long-chain acyl-CoA synthetase